MKILLTTIAFLSFVQSSFTFALTNINQLPFECNIPGETYILTADLTSGFGNAITVNANDVTLNGNGKTLTYGAYEVGNAITIGRNVANLEILNWNIIQGSGGGHAFDSVWYTPDGLHIHNNTFKSEQIAQPVIILREPHNDISNFSINNNEISLNDRLQGASKAIDINLKNSLTGKIHNNVITTGPNIYKNRNSCISIVGGLNGAVEIFNNTLNLNTKAEGEGIRLYASDNNIIYGNTINMNCYDCRGILIDGGSDNNIISTNAIFLNIRTGGNSNSYGIRIRFSSSYNTIKDNTINANQCATDSRPVAISIGGTQAETPGISTDNVFISNYITSPRYYSITVDQGSIGTRFHDNTFISTESNIPVYVRPFTGEENIKGLEFRNNIFNHESNFAVWFDFYYSHTVEPVVFCNNNIIDDVIGLAKRNVDYTVACINAIRSRQN